MTKKIGIVALVMLALCMIVSVVSAQAVTLHQMYREVDSETYTDIFDLPPNCPYTQVKMTSTLTTEYSGMYNAVLDANGYTHFNGKVVIQMTVQREAWYWSDTLQEWVSGYSGSGTSKQIIGYNELILNSETQTSKELLLSRQKIDVKGINPLNGEPLTQQYVLISHFMVKWVNGQLQFENSWSIENPPS